MERMNYINKDKNYMTDKERIKYLEESIRELRIEKDEIRKEKGEIRQRLVKLEKAQAELSRVKENKELIKENKKLIKENKKLRDDNIFLTKISKEYMEKENIVQVTEFTELYKNNLEEENKKLKKYYDRDKEELMESCYSLARENDKLKSDLMQDMKEITKLEKENKKLKEERIFSLGEYDYMILTSTTPKLKIIKKNQNYSLMEEDTLQELRDIGEI